MPAKWYLLQTKRNKERLVCRQLAARQIHHICPLESASDDTPMAQALRNCFRNYIFVRLDPEKRRLDRLNWLQGARGVVARAGEPVVVSNSLIESVQICFNHDKSNSTDLNQLLSYMLEL